MKKLSDYKGEDAIDLWADLLEPISAITSDREIAVIAKAINQKLCLRKRSLNGIKEATEILLAIDDTPINAINIVLRLISLINEISEYDEIMDFFALQGQKTEGGSSGSVMENTEASEN